MMDIEQQQQQPQLTTTTKPIHHDENSHMKQQHQHGDYQSYPYDHDRDDDDDDEDSDIEAQNEHIQLLKNSHSFYSTDLNNINWASVVNFSGIQEHVQQRLRQVYLSLTLTVMSATLGALFYMNVLAIPLVLSLVAVIVLLVALKMTESPKEAFSYLHTRSLGLYLFGFVNGLYVGPLVQSVAELDPKLPLVALGATTVIFACFSGFALFAKRRSYLYLGATLTSCLSILVITAFFALLFPFQMVQQLSSLALLYGGLVLFIGFVIFDTQLMIEKLHSGYTDVVHLALELFMDFVAIFVRILIILANSKKRNSSE